ncbi:reverse transcriptase domain-containing protein [Hyphomonas sp.]|uniref:RNA-directed DNA polymerase n=1 Tax=Hyphomonas sp. TaxID=87 RepID=UPI00391D93E2
MPRRHNDLFPQIASFEALRRAARKAIRGKRRKRGGAAFQFALERELLALERELLSGTYRTGRYVEIELVRPKKRLVSAAPMRDRVVQHALMDVIGPIFDQGFIGNSFANRIGKGTHRAIGTYERYRDRHAHVLRCDIFRYFPAIDHEILKHDFRRRIKCPRTLILMDTLIDGSNPQEPVNLHFPGDDLFAPFARRRGLPIGNLMSQFSANLYLDPLDHFCTEVLRAPYLRYVDDFALFHDDPAVLAGWRDRIAQFLEKRRLRLHPRKTFVASTGEPAEFLGMLLHANGKRALPETNIQAFKGRLKGMVRAVHAATLSHEDMAARIASWQAHAKHAHTYAARRAILGRAMRQLRAGT